MTEFERFLLQRLTNPLPGSRAQNRMRPHPAELENPTFKPNTPENSEYRNSSVLVPIITWEQEFEVILTLRTNGIKHGGQLSFPGGGKEGNETYEETALREAHEEIGLNTETVSVAGELTPLFVNHSNNMVTPIVGFLNDPQEFTPNPNEVDEIFSVPFSELLTHKNQIREEWDLRDKKYTVPFFDVHHVPLWGATAMMMSELLELYQEFRNNS